MRCGEERLASGLGDEVEGRRVSAGNNFGGDRAGGGKEEARKKKGRKKTEAGGNNVEETADGTGGFTS
jgi:hypothetical protein